MLVLDLDLDFFVDPIAYGNTGIERLSEAEYKVWTEDHVRQFLESQCGLSRTDPVPGRVFNEHHEAFFWWRQLIDDGQLEAPFDLVHVDAHADLGVGKGGLESHRFISTVLLHWPVRARRFPETFAEARFGPANFLAFALTCRWLSTLTYVTHPLAHPKHDYYDFLFHDDQIDSGWIEMKACYTADFDAMVGGPALFPESYEPPRLEPRVKFQTVKCTKVSLSRKPDFISLTISPGYTPTSADRLVSVIQEYIET